MGSEGMGHRRRSVIYRWADLDAHATIAVASHPKKGSQSAISVARTARTARSRRDAPALYEKHDLRNVYVRLNHRHFHANRRAEHWNARSRTEGQLERM